jgi:hypothetical protein
VRRRPARARTPGALLPAPGPGSSAVAPTAARHVSAGPHGEHAIVRSQQCRADRRRQRTAHAVQRGAHGTCSASARHRSAAAPRSARKQPTATRDVRRACLHAQTSQHLPGASCPERCPTFPSPGSLWTWASCRCYEATRMAPTGWRHVATPRTANAPALGVDQLRSRRTADHRFRGPTGARRRR